MSTINGRSRENRTHYLRHIRPRQIPLCFTPILVPAVGVEPTVSPDFKSSRFANLRMQALFGRGVKNRTLHTPKFGASVAFPEPPPLFCSPGRSRTDNHYVLSIIAIPICLRSHLIILWVLLDSNQSHPPCKDGALTK